MWMNRSGCSCRMAVNTGLAEPVAAHAGRRYGTRRSRPRTCGTCHRARVRPARARCIGSGSAAAVPSARMRPRRPRRSRASGGGRRLCRELQCDRTPGSATARGARRTRRSTLREASAPEPNASARASASQTGTAPTNSRRLIIVRLCPESDDIFKWSGRNWQDSDNASMTCELAGNGLPSPRCVTIARRRGHPRMLFVGAP